MFTKVLVANRGEIAVRAFRAAYELGAQTVAVFPHEDRGSEHRLKADEAYEIGERGHPVRAYLDPEVIVQAAVRPGADAVYPGYGFLSENPKLAEACADAGITFIGPTAEVLTLTGNKARADRRGQGGRRPVPGSVAPSTDVDELVAAASDLPYPLFVKAVAGGGGRGMRKGRRARRSPRGDRGRMREASGAFGDPTVFVEQAVVDPRHIEVQILADGSGQRHPPLRAGLLGAAPAPEGRRDRAGAEPRPGAARPDVRRRRPFAKQIGYRNAGTVEFLLDPHGNYVFIEMNPRIQVEHTVTEEVTDVDLVQSQMRIAAGETSTTSGSRRTASRCAAPPCSAGSPPRTRPTASAPTPADHDLPVARWRGHAARRRDDVHGAEVSAHFDSMLAKLTCRGRDFASAVDRARRALAEFRIRGVATNIPFLQACSTTRTSAPAG